MVFGWKMVILLMQNMLLVLAGFYILVYKSLLFLDYNVNLFFVLNFHITTYLNNVFLFKKKQWEIYLISTTNQQFIKILSINNYDSIIIGAPAGSHGLPRNFFYK